MGLVITWILLNLLELLDLDKVARKNTVGSSSVSLERETLLLLLLLDVPFFWTRMRFGVCSSE